MSIAASRPRLPALGLHLNRLGSTAISGLKGLEFFSRARLPLFCRLLFPWQTRVKIRRLARRSEKSRMMSGF